MQWLSHVPKHRLAVFLAAWHRRLSPGAVVFLGDNQPHEGMDEQPYAKPGEADTYELRRLPDGSCFEIVKNYFNAMELQALLAPWAADVRLHMGDYWWWLSYTAVSPIRQRRLPSPRSSTTAPRAGRWSPICAATHTGSS